MKTRHAIAVIAAILMGLLLIPGFLYMYQVNSGSLEGIRRLGEDFELHVGEERVKVELPFSEENTPDGMIISRKLTADETGKWGCIETDNDWISVYAGDTELARTDSMRSLKYGDIPVSGILTFQIPEGTEELSFHITSPYRYSKLRMRKIYVADKVEMLIDISNTQDKFDNMVEFVLLMGGIYLLVYGIYWQLWMKKTPVVWLHGCCVFLMGMCLANRSQAFGKAICVTLAWRSIYALCKYLLPVMLAAFLGHYIPDRWRKYRTIVYGLSAYGVLSLILAGMGALELQEMTVTYQAIMILMLFFVLYDLISLLHPMGDEKYRIGLIGVCILFVLCFADFMMYILADTPFGSLERYGILCCCVIIAAEEIRYLEQNRMERLEIEVQDEENLRKAVLSQLQPNFMFHALGNIREEMRENTEKASSMIYDFSNFLRSTVYALTQEGMIPFSQELGYIKSYMNLEMQRYPGEIIADYAIEFSEFYVPPLTIEPLVVNAVVHGIRQGRKGNTITVRTHRQANTVIIEVEDDGMGFDMQIWEIGDEPISQDIDWTEVDIGDGSYMGVSSICRRLKTALNATVQLESVIGKGTKVHIEIPDVQ